MNERERQTKQSARLSALDTSAYLISSQVFGPYRGRGIKPQQNGNNEKEKRRKIDK